MPTIRPDADWDQNVDEVTGPTDMQHTDLAKGWRQALLDGDITPGDGASFSHRRYNLHNINLFNSDIHINGGWDNRGISGTARPNPSPTRTIAAGETYKRTALLQETENSDGTADVAFRVKYRNGPANIYLRPEFQAMRSGGDSAPVPNQIIQPGTGRFRSDMEGVMRIPAPGADMRFWFGVVLGGFGIPAWSNPGYTILSQWFRHFDGRAKASQHGVDNYPEFAGLTAGDDVKWTFRQVPQGQSGESGKVVQDLVLEPVDPDYDD